MFIIGITGGSASGKTLACHKLFEKLVKRGKNVSVMSEDNFYYGLPDGMSSENYDFDSPEAIDFKSIYESINKLKNEEKDIEIPTYNFGIHKTDGTTTIKFCDVLIVEGILLFTDKKLSELFDLKIYVNASPEIRLIRRIQRDMLERGRDLDSIFKAYLKFVKPSYDKYISPTKSDADIVINNDSNDGDHHLSSKVNIIVSHVMLREKDYISDEDDLQELIIL